MVWDKQTFASVFDAHFAQICRFLECMLGGSGNAQDIAQETFVRLYRKGSPTMPADEIRFWLYRVARNLALNELSKMRTRNRLVDKVRMALTPKVQHPEQTYEESERRQILEGLLDCLSERHRAVLVLREQQEMSYAEIARVLNISENTVKIDIHRARMRLRERWNEIHKAPAKAKIE